MIRIPVGNRGLKGLDISLFRERGSILGKDFSIDILRFLLSNPYSIASEVAERFNIHIATAQKYLSEMEKAKLVASRLRQTGRKPAKEYYLVSDKIKLEIDLSKSLETDVGLKLERQRIREKANQNVAYEWDSEKPVIKEIILVSSRDGRRRAERIPLEDVEGRFLWQVPLPGEGYKSAAQIAREVGIRDPKDLESVERLLDLLAELGVVEREAE